MLNQAARDRQETLDPGSGHHLQRGTDSGVRIIEAALIRERTMAGLAAARARGRVGGRPTVWTPDKLAAARQMHAAGQHDVAAIARVLGVSRASVYRALSASTSR